MPQSISAQHNSQEKKTNARTNVVANWWAPIWRGLIVDESAKHYRAMRNAVWLYLYLLLFAKRSTGIVKRQLSTITAHTGINRRTLQRYLLILRKAGYITVENSERTFTLSIEKWKPINRRTPFSVNSQKDRNIFRLRSSTEQPRPYLSNGQNGFQRTLFHQ